MKIAIPTPIVICDFDNDGSVAYSKQSIIQLFFGRQVSYGNMSQVLATEGFHVSKKTVWRSIESMERFLASQGVADPSSWSMRCYLLAILKWASAVLSFGLWCSLKILLSVVPWRSVALVPDKHLVYDLQKACTTYTSAKTWATATTTERTGYLAPSGTSHVLRLLHNSNDKFLVTVNSGAGSGYCLVLPFLWRVQCYSLCNKGKVL